MFTPQFDKFVQQLYQSQKRYLVLHGGRGSGKSYKAADLVILYALTNAQGVILCAREFQNSIKDSSKSLLEKRINDLGVAKYFDVKLDEIRCKTGVSVIFKGLRHNVESIKSIEDVIFCWVEEASTISKTSYDVLTPTIRAKDSKILFTLNPKSELDVIYQKFVAKDSDIAFVKEINYTDNPHFTDTLEAERMEAERKLTREEYEHIWLGKLLRRGDDCILNQYEIKNLDEQTEGLDPLLGLDFGFSQDPTAFVESYIMDKTLYLKACTGGVNIKNEDIAHTILKTCPVADKVTIVADNARPETIDYLKRNGLPGIIPSKKGKGSIEDGIEKIKTYNLAISPACKAVIFELENYKYKVCQYTGNILDIIVDKHNHYIDALRYALEPVGTAINWDNVL